jgi:antitoxin (DNA-binding transcriptional repressor) of toxin-antitoxin stability system
MKELTVGEFKAHFSELLELVKRGEKVKILYGKAKKPIAMLVPPEGRTRGRKIGILEGKATFSFVGDGKITEEEFLGLDE